MRILMTKRKMVYYCTILLFNSCCLTILLFSSIDSLPSKNNKSSSESSKTLQPKSSANTREPTVQVKSKKKAKNISAALEVAMKRDYTWEPSSEDDI